MKLNLGCGGDLRKGYLNIDIQVPGKGSNRGENLDEFDFKQSDASDLSWLKDNTVEEILAKDILDHIHWKNLSETFKEWARVLKPCAQLYLREMPDFEKSAMKYFNSKRDRRSWEKFQRWVERLSYPEENLRSKNLLDFPHLKMMLEEQGLIVQKHWYEGEGLNIDCQKL